MKILAIETSCDETAIALLEIEGRLPQPQIQVLGHALFSQASLHEQYGGVYPNLAKREHEKNLPLLLKQCFIEAGINEESPQIDLITVTTGPGLEPALWTGITFAQKLGEKWGKPVIPVNHMEGHIYSVLAQDNNLLRFPAIALLVSGGHTELVNIEDFGKYQLLGKTLDDAVGEAFDKVARILGLSYPGGPKISKLANEAREAGQPETFKLPRPMLHTKDFNFSFSGLKTAVLYKVKERGEVTEEFRREVARAFEDAAVEVLVEKTRRAIEAKPQTQTLIVAGGVSANKHLAHEVKTLSQSYPQLAIRFPSLELSTDNAIMIGIAAFVNTSISPTPPSSSNLIAEGNLSIS